MRDAFQEKQRLDEATAASQKINALESVIVQAKQITDQLRAAQARMAAGVTTGGFDQADLDSFNTKAETISRGILRACLALGDLAGGPVVITVAGQPLE